MPPSESAQKGMLSAEAAAFNPSMSVAVLAANPSKNPVLRISFKVAKPHAVATGLPDKVPA
jgi:hypothetical protein